MAFKKTLLPLLLASLLALPARPAQAAGPAATAFAAAGTLLLVAIPVAVVGYLIFKGAGGDKPAGQKPAPEQPAEKSASQPGTPAAPPAKQP